MNHKSNSVVESLKKAALEHDITGFIKFADMPLVMESLKSGYPNVILHTTDGSDLLNYNYHSYVFYNGKEHGRETIMMDADENFNEANILSGVYDMLQYLNSSDTPPTVIRLYEISNYHIRYSVGRG